MKKLGIEDAHVDDKCYVYGTLPAKKGYEDKTKLGFIAHLDTSEDMSGQNVNPQIIENYDGKDINLGESGRVIKVSDFEHLKDFKGRRYIERVTECIPIEDKSEYTYEYRKENTLEGKFDKFFDNATRYFSKTTDKK